MVFLYVDFEFVIGKMNFKMTDSIWRTKNDEFLQFLSKCVFNFFSGIFEAADYESDVIVSKFKMVQMRGRNLKNETLVNSFVNSLTI